MAKLVYVNQCPVYNDIGPYFALSAKDAHVDILSLYRGPGAENALHRYGHHSQPELCNANAEQRREWGILGTPDPWDESTHCLRSDGRAYTFAPVRAHLPWWGQGCDVNGAGQAQLMIAAAARRGWEMFRPYPGGAEAHHVNFKVQPHPGRVGGKQWTQIMTLRHTLPRCPA